MRHFIVKTISTSTEKGGEHEGEIIGTDVERGFIDFIRAGRGQGIKTSPLLLCVTRFTPGTRSG
jgi:hypothetical protein